MYKRSDPADQPSLSASELERCCSAVRVHHIVGVRALSHLLMLHSTDQVRWSQPVRLVSSYRLKSLRGRPYCSEKHLTSK